MAIHVGTSGWSYDHWTGILYPRQARSLERLAAYAREFSTVEVNNTFYRWPKPEVFATWKRLLPKQFIVSVKASRGLTHFNRLNSPTDWLTRMEAGLSQLAEKRGPLLCQLPPQMQSDFDRLDQFLTAVPVGNRTAIEFRHPSWNVEQTFSILRRHQAAYCVMSGAHLPCELRATSNFVFVRLHGPDHQNLYSGSYSDSDLRWWGDRVNEWSSQELDVFIYFNNDGYGHAVRNALRLKERLGV